MDNLVPVVVALVGILIMFVLFKGISSADVKVLDVPNIAQTTRKSRLKKPASEKSAAQALDLEMEALIARDIARSSRQTGMSADTKRLQPEILESEQGRHKVKALPKNILALNEQDEAETSTSKDSSFQTVQYFARQNRKKKDVLSKPVEDIDQKLMNFFRNSKSQKISKSKGNAGEASPQAEVGGHVMTYGALNMARSWDEPH
ncbi:unnamed protein product [Phytomonas sp. EM1]|nr:unnamed protein product [Phytomonas sp. EM1]|eukprot:CCW64394.1 unnamed protein product [Phytomonas sp. isolate EM1]